MIRLPVSPQQVRAFQEATSSIVVYEGAVRSGKSFTACTKLLDMAKNAPAGDLLMTGYSQDSIKKNMVGELISGPNTHIWGRNIRYFPGKRELMIGERKIHLVGAHDERSVGSIQGSTFSGALVDEATLMPESFFKMLRSRLSRPKSQAILTCNPDNPQHWLKTGYIDNPDIDIKVFKFRLTDNPSLSPEYIENLKLENKGMWYRRYIEGEWCLAEGCVYDFFDPDIHCISYAPTYAKYFIVGVDYGTTNPCAFTMVGFNDDVQPSLWVEKEFYFSSRERGYQKTDLEYAEDLRKFVEGYPVKLIYIDPSAASFKLECSRMKLPISDAKNDVLNGIRTVSKHLSCGNLKIMRDCTNLIDEMYAYVWDDKKAKRGLDEPIKAFDHLLDSLRYAIFSHFGEKTDLKEKNREEREREMINRMYKKNPMIVPYGFQKF